MVINKILKEDMPPNKIVRLNTTITTFMLIILKCDVEPDRLEDSNNFTGSCISYQVKNYI